VRRRGEFLTVLGRVRSGLGKERIESDLRRVGTLLQAAFPQTNEGLTFTAVSLPDHLLGAVRAPLVMLLGAVGFVLLVACANVANLLLARVRTSTGNGRSRGPRQSRGRLLRQLLTESVVLGSLAARLDC
jgi:hypothetical protein